MKWIWIPYRKNIPHRGMVSHGFLIGTLVRILYLFIIFSTVFLGFGFLFTKQFNLDIYLLKILTTIKDNKEYYVSIFLALEFSAVIHIVADKLQTFFKKFKSTEKL